MLKNFTMPENFSIFDYDLADLLGGDFDLSGTPVDLGFVPTYEISPGTDNYYTLTGGIEQYKERLQEGADYAKIDDVDKVDDFYDQSFQSNLSAIQVDPETYLRETASPTYLANWQGRPEQQAAEDVYGSIAITDQQGTQQAVSNYYGYDVQADAFDKTIEDFGGNYGEHTGASQEKISEFQSIIKPILTEQIAFLQTTEDLSYQDALVEAYNRDPMVQSLYAKYDVTPFRQTSDGSTYLYDPLSFSEIRTKEVKDTGVQDGLKALAIMVATAGAGSALGGYLAASTSMSAPLANAVGSAVASAGSTLATGGDTSDILRSAILAGAGGYREGLVQVAEGAEALALQGTFSAQSEQLLAGASKAASDIERFDKVVNTAKFVNAAVNDDVLGGFVDLYGSQLTNKALDKLGLDQKTLDAKYGGIQRDDMTAGLVKMQRRLAGGADFESALMDGFGTYVRKGGTLGIDIDTPEFIERIGDVIKEAGSSFDDFVLQPPKEAIEALLSSLPDKTPDQVKAIEDYARTVGSKAENVARETVAVVDEPIQEAGQAVAEVAQEVKERAEEVYEQVDLPTGTTPEGPDIPKAGSMGLSGIDADLDLDFDFQAPEFGEISEGLFSDYLSKYADPGLLERRRFRGYTAPQGMFRNIV
jgi:hypothetical protein